MNKTIEIEVYPDGRLDVFNTAKYLGLSDKTLAMMRCNGTGPLYIKQGKVFYFKSDLDQWLLQNGKRASTAQASRYS